MKNAFIVAATLTLKTITSTAVHADAIQILDTNTMECIQQSLDAVDMPRARVAQETYGQTVKTAFITEDITANLTLNTTQFVPPRYGANMANSTISFTADITHIQENDYDYEHRRTISVTFNDEGQVTQLNDGDTFSYWVAAPYNYVSTNSSRPELSADQQEQIEAWIDNAVETATFMFMYCQTGAIYEPKNGDAVSPPQFANLNALRI
jgi:hypothetical protein